MKTVVKHIISFILPVTVLLIVPLLIEQHWVIRNMFCMLTGGIILFTGLTLMSGAVIEFIRWGNGTLAPWFPTRKLITTGLYAHLRNPMITGVVITLIGEAVCILSYSILIWAIAFFLINDIYFLMYEEPNLERKFGEEYRQYKQKVPRWIPRFKKHLT
jgi:protein-S-isoprenylcysteine O-methyltransferase Ste14